jgi:hypothetical protein
MTSYLDIFVESIGKARAIWEIIAPCKSPMGENVALFRHSAME